MNGLYITVDGVVGSDPKRSVWNGDPIISFRFVTQERRYDRGRGGWIDGHCSWMTVSCFRALAKNVDDSVRKGDRLIVHGRVRVKDFVADDGALRTGVTLEADGVGHNLTFGTARFRPSRTAESPEEQIRAHADGLMRELADQPLEDVQTLIAHRAAAGDGDLDGFEETVAPDASLQVEELDDPDTEVELTAQAGTVQDAGDPETVPAGRSPGRTARASRRKEFAQLTG